MSSASGTGSVEGDSRGDCVFSGAMPSSSDILQLILQVRSKWRRLNDQVDASMYPVNVASPVVKIYMVGTEISPSR